MRNKRKNMNYLMKLLKLLIKNILQNRFYNLVTILFVAVSVFFMNLSLAEFRHCMYQNTQIKTSGLYDSYMYCGIPTKQVYYRNTGEDVLSKVNDHVYQTLEDAKKNGEINNYFPVCQFSSVAGKEHRTETEVFYGSYYLLKDLSYPVIEGEWFHTYAYEARENALIPVVVGYHLRSVYPLGQTISLDNSGVNAIVIGILKPNTMFLKPGGGGSGMNLNSVTQSADDIVIAANEIPGTGFHSYLIKISKNAPDRSRKVISERVSDYIETFSFQHLADEAYADNLFLIQSQATISILALLVCIAGMGCGSYLSFVRGKRRQAIYFLCGMDKKTGIFLHLLDGAVKLYVPLAVGLFVFFSFCRKQEFNGLYVDGVNVALSVFVNSVILAGTLVRTLHIAKKNDVLNIIHS